MVYDSWSAGGVVRYAVSCGFRHEPPRTLTVISSSLTLLPMFSLDQTHLTKQEARRMSGVGIDALNHSVPIVAATPDRVLA